MSAAARKDRKLSDHLKALSTAAILKRAEKVMGSIVRPLETHHSPLSELPPNPQSVEIDLEETLESSPWSIANADRVPPRPEDLWMEYQSVRDQSVILAVDTSLSMTGEKLALTAVALAVVLLQFPEDRVGILAFENEPRVLKRPSEKITVDEFVGRFLNVPAQGYTHLESGMRAAILLLREASVAGSRRPPSTVLVTDGKYTAGKDPSYLAGRFPHLIVLKMGRERASLPLCEEIAKKGRGSLREVDDLDVLPAAMYDIVKDLLRGTPSRV
ncbi:MAG: VWA domain-containing protein [Cryobacterium sp.]|nr:VWA domain-containing protein [Oligoflexia bacterium]